MLTTTTKIFLGKTISPENFKLNSGTRKREKFVHTFLICFFKGQDKRFKLGFGSELNFGLVLQ